MVQKCSQLKIIEVFFKEPTEEHFIKEIARKIKLAPTSVRNILKEFEREKLILKKDSKPFNSLIANRENEEFIFYKRVYNLLSIKDLSKVLIKEYYPKLMVLYGSYSIGEDREDSDLDLLIIGKSKKEINLKKFEEKLKRKINLFLIEDINKLDENLINKVHNGIVLYGSF